MKLTHDQVEYYGEHGLLFIQELFSTQKVKAMQAAVEDLIVKDTPGRILEKDNKTVRALHGCHTTTEIFDSFCSAIPQSPKSCLRKFSNN
ncbi:hypothetical protein AB0758_48245 [Tolypothrix bouteillei VB521301_2]|uniref:hypothetical protein n=1 Tax=Tolypothrix bouteillei TaxID=1246981 RepID=UPI0038B523E7